MPSSTRSWRLAATSSTPPTCTAMEQLEDNLGAAGLHLEADEQKTLEAASDPAAADYPYGGPGTKQRSRKIAGGR
jgi:aryl-alcohol dehydrogenase-like predicted oxidoreductase